MKKIAPWIFYFYLFLLPWQARYIFVDATLEYSKISFYATDVLLIILAALALTQRDSSKQKSSEEKRLFVSLALFGCMGLASLYWAEDKIVGLLALTHLAEGLLLVWISFQLRIDCIRASLVLIMAGVLQSIIGIAEYIFQRVPGNTWLGMASHAPEILGDQVIEGSFGRILRAYGTLDHPNILGGFLVFCIILIIALFPVAKERMQKIFLLASGSILTMGMFFTFSRAAWLAFIALIMIQLFQPSRFNPASRDENSWKTRTLPLIFLGIFFVLATSSLPLLKTRLQAESRLEQKSLDERAAYQADALKIIKKNWPTGVGIGNFSVITKNQPAHNLYLVVFAELGIFGLLFFLYMLGSFLPRSAISLWGPFFLLTFFDHYFFTLHFGILFFWLAFSLFTQRNTVERTP